jgi:hypothetical protein
MASQKQSDYTVRFSHIARVLECEGPGGIIEFTFDGKVKDANVLVLEHHASDTERGPHYDGAFQHAKQFLESCGYQVELQGS